MAEIIPPAPTLVREKSYDSTYKDKIKGTEYLEFQANQIALLNALDRLSPEQKKAIDIYQTVVFCNIIHKALDMQKIPQVTEIVNKLKADIEVNSYSSDELDIFKYIKYQLKLDLPNVEETIHTLDNIFSAILPITKPLITYRCYSNYINEAKLNQLFLPDNPYKNKRYISTSLSFKMVTEWCEEGDTKFRICVYIPEGTKIIPVVFFKYENVKQNEMLLPRTGALKPTGLIHPIHNVPFYVYVDNYADPIDAHIEDIRSKFNIPIVPNKHPFLTKRTGDLRRRILSQERLGTGFGGKYTRKLRKKIKR
jgi:hypothetical protein